MNALVIDASIALKWVVDEKGTPEALRLRRVARLLAPDLLAVECANILWKKVQRHEMAKEEAPLAARLLQGSEIELLPTRALLEAATRIALALDHPAYDCIYLAAAIDNHCQFVTADQRLLRKLGQKPRTRLRDQVIALSDAAAVLDAGTD